MKYNAFPSWQLRARSSPIDWEWSCHGSSIYCWAEPAFWQILLVLRQPSGKQGDLLVIIRYVLQNKTDRILSCFCFGCMSANMTNVLMSWHEFFFALAMSLWLWTRVFWGYKINTIVQRPRVAPVKRSVMVFTLYKLLIRTVWLCCWASVQSSYWLI